VAVTFDMAGKTFRHEKYEAYKGTRVKADQALYDQIPLAHEAVEVFGIPIYEKSGFEADDVIGTIVEKLKKENDIETYIVTGDMDTLQLVSPKVKVYTLRKGMNDTVVYDEKGVKERFGFGPELVVEYKALRGDVSDNIPGVPGIGEKTATELIQKIGSIQEIYNKLEKSPEKFSKEFKPGVIKKLSEGKHKAEMSLYLATIDCNVPELDFKLENCKIKPFDREKIIDLFQRFEFVSLLKRIPELNQQDGVGVKGPSPLQQGKKKKIISNELLQFTEAKTEQDVENIKKTIKENKQFSCNIILQGTDLFTSIPQGMVVVTGEEKMFIPHKFFTIARELFQQEEIELVGHNIKELIKILAIQGVVLKNIIFDVMMASYLLNPGSRAHEVPSVVLKVLGKELVQGNGQESLFGVDPRVKAEELYLLNKCADILKTQLIKIDDYGLMKKIEMPLIFVLAHMELAGVAVDRGILDDLSKRIHNQISVVSKEIYKLAGVEFNIASPLQLREILFEKMDIPVEGIKKGKTGLSTSAESLEKLHGMHPIIEKIEEFRELSKLQNTYVDVLPTLINTKTHRIHAKFNQAVAATGRLSSSDPNLQNIPIRTELGREIRYAFIAEPGRVLVSADYSQLELRIVASLAEDKKMMEIFEAGLDIHAATAAAINGVPLDKVTKQMRYAAKEVNFGVLYGMGTHGLSWRAGISYAEAKQFIEKYFQEFSGVKKYIERTLEFTKKEGYCETLFGRRRYLPELNATNHQLRAAAERMAVNHPIQGTEADMIKMAMIEVFKKIQSFKNSNLILQVHDELVLEVPEADAEKISKILKDTMENVVKLRVPVNVEVHTGKNWGEVH
jgi:DNA polymerase-1